MNEEQTTNTQPAAPPAPELTVTDLTNVRSVLDVAVRRGAFGASELSSVGAIYDKLNTFLNAISNQKPEEKPAEPKQ